LWAFSLKEPMRFYTVSDKYINFLKKIVPSVPDNYLEKRSFIGIILEINDIEYLAPLTSYKKKQDTFKPSLPTLFKLHERTDPTNKLGMIQFNNMIPTIKSEISLLNIDIQPEPYKQMLYKQFEFIKQHKDEIKKRAIKLYKLVTVSKHPFYTKISCNFKLLEENIKNFR
jgi:protein AbiQ